MGERHTSFHSVVANRILLELQRLGNATTRQLLEQMPDVSQTSMYRVIKQLCGQGSIRVLEERKARGLVERIYALPGTGLSLPVLDTDTSYLQRVASYYNGMLDALRKHSLYSEREPEEDGACFFAIPAMLTPVEALQLAETMSATITEIQHNRPAARRNMLEVSFHISPALHQVDEDGLSPTGSAE